MVHVSLGHHRATRHIPSYPAPPPPPGKSLGTRLLDIHSADEANKRCPLFAWFALHTLFSKKPS